MAYLDPIKLMRALGIIFRDTTQENQDDSNHDQEVKKVTLSEAYCTRNFVQNQSIHFSLLIGANCLQGLKPTAIIASKVAVSRWQSSH